MTARITLLIALTVASLVAAPRTAESQIETQRGIIAGRVRVPGDTPGVVGALETIVGRREQQTTDAHGEFRFNGIVPGRYEVRVRRLGMEQLIKFVTVGPGEATMHHWEMRLLPQMLAEVRVNGQSVRVPPAFQEPFRRAAWGFGDFVLRDDVERRNPVTTKHMLEMLPGVHVNDRGLSFERCGSEVVAPAGTGGNITSEAVSNAGLSTGLSSDQISSLGVQVYVDGHRMTNLAMTVDDVLSSVHPKDIEIMEVYRGVARIPAEFLYNACAVIAIWTKRG
jgi:hypothetical protein